MTGKAHSPIACDPVIWRLIPPDAKDYFAAAVLAVKSIGCTLY
jgi:hypothetical protein